MWLREEPSPVCLRCHLDWKLLGFLTGIGEFSPRGRDGCNKCYWVRWLQFSGKTLERNEPQTARRDERITREVGEEPRAHGGVFLLSGAAERSLSTKLESEARMGTLQGSA